MNYEILVLLLINTFSGAGYSLLAPLYPSIAKSRGIGEEVVGLVISTFAISNFFATPFIPKIISKFGRKRVLLFALILEACCLVIYGFVDCVENIYLFLTISFVARFFHGIGASSSGTLVYSVAASISEPGEVTKTFGILEYGWCLGLAIGPLMASIFYYLGDYPLPFYVLTSFLIVCIIMVWKMRLPEHQHSGAEPNFLKALFDCEVFTVFLTPMMDMIGRSFIFPTFTNHLVEQFGMSVSGSSLFFVMNMVSYFFFLQILTPFTKRYGMKLALVIGVLSISIGVLFLPPLPMFPNSLITIIIGLLILGIPGAFINVPAICELGRILSERSSLGYNEDTAHDVAAALFNYGINIGETFGPAFGGYITENGSFEKSCTYVSGITLTYGILFLFLNYRNIKQTLNASSKVKSLQNKIASCVEDEEKILKQPLLAKEEMRNNY